MLELPFGYRIPKPLLQEIIVSVFPYANQTYWLDSVNHVIYDQFDKPIAHYMNGCIMWNDDQMKLDLADQYPYFVPDLTQICMESSITPKLNTNTNTPVVSNKNKIVFSGTKLKMINSKPSTPHTRPIKII